MSFRRSIRRRRARAALAGLACALSALIALPGLHLVGHREDHEHVGAGGIRYRTLAEVAGFPAEAAEPEVEHEHGHEHEHDRRSPPRPHGDGASEHLSVALLAGVAAPTLPPPRALRISFEAFTAPSLISTSSPAPQARGPPRAS